MVQRVIENWPQTAWPFRLQMPRCHSSYLLGLGIDESSDSALLSSFITSEYFSSAILISLSFSGRKLCNQAHYSPSERLGTKHERTGFGTPNLQITIWGQKFVCHNLVHKTEFVSLNLVHKTAFVSHNLVHKTEFVSHNLVHKTKFLSHNLVHKTEFVSHNLVHKTEFVSHN